MRRTVDSSGPARAAVAWGEISGGAGLVSLVACFLALSWRRWPDPLIDFGREIYTPWRLAEGALLYRDVDNFYGPLSKYFNAALFALFKPGLMVLVSANLVVFGAILALLYFLLRQAWGAGSALFSSAIFITVFGFSQFVVIANYNYATPYSHEATHGLLICLALAFVLVQWVEEATLPLSFLAGLLLGLTALLKPEILFAAGIVTGVAAIARCRRGYPRMRAIAVWVGGALLPTAGFTAYFLFFLPFHQALFFACHGWLSVVTTTRFTGDKIEMAFLGLNQPWQHFRQHALATLAACALIGTIAGVTWLSEKTEHRLFRTTLAVVLAGAMAWLGCFIIEWREIGRCLFGLVLLYVLITGAIGVFRHKPEPTSGRAEITRLLIAVLALALMARMILNGRIYQYGFYQAALAAVIVPALVIGELPRRLGLRRAGQTALIIGFMALLVPGIVILARQSAGQLRLKSFVIGEGRDRFYAFPPELEATGETVRLICERLGQDNEAKTLVVLPEGIMINYLTRRPSPVAPFFFFSSATEGGREEEIVEQLAHAPPDAAVIIGRNLHEYGIESYGERPGSGQLIVQWVNENYRVDLQSPHAVILKHK